VKNKEVIIVNPSASALSQSLRSIGYSFNDAVCDIIDNSISAIANTIDVSILWQDERATLSIFDDGCGMDRALLIEAMRPGTRSPLEKRTNRDLGRFGLGLKTASFSQSPKLSVTSWINTDSCHKAEWDLNRLAASNNWNMTLESLTKPPKETVSGTIVQWLDLDFLANTSRDEADDQLARMISGLSDHIGRTYHRFIEGDTARRVAFVVNGIACKPINPFFPEKSTKRPMERIPHGNKEYFIQAYTLPHSSKCTEKEWRENQGPNGYLESQGFYLYRNNRLIVAGSWFSLASKKESTKLCRASIDIDQDSDLAWQIDIKKSSAVPPVSIRKRLKGLISNLTSNSRQAQFHRSRTLATNDIFPVWNRRIIDGSIEYKINNEHPIISKILCNLCDDEKGKLESLLNLIENTLPTRAIYRDLTDDSASICQPEIELETLVLHAQEMKNLLMDAGRSATQIYSLLQHSEMFRLRWGEIRDLL